MQHALGLAWPTSGSRSPFLQTAPTLEPMALRRGSIPNVLLAAGASSAAILSEHGRELDAISFPVRGLAGIAPLSHLQLYNPSLCVKDLACTWMT